jgi:hypothetical protein
MKLFNYEKLHNKDCLISGTEYKILRAVIERKFCIILPQKLNSFTLAKDLQDILDKEMTKPLRPEQQYKFVFKKIFKMLKNDFKQFTPNNGLFKEQFESLFISYYFQEVADKHQIDLSILVPPTNSISNTHFRSINKQYVSWISKSEKFMVQYNDIYHNRFLKSCKQEIESKIESLLNNWNYSQISNQAKQESDLLNYIRLSKRCKLPWTIKEIQCALVASQKLFQVKEKKGSQKSTKEV